MIETAFKLLMGTIAFVLGIFMCLGGLNSFTEPVGWIGLVLMVLGFQLIGPFASVTENNAKVAPTSASKEPT